MPPLLGDWNVSRDEWKEFDEIFDVAITLGIRNRKKKAEKVKKLLEWGERSIKPLLYTVECYLEGESSTDDQIDKRADLVSDVILQIGPKAIPVLTEIAENGGVNIYINELAEDLIERIKDKSKTSG